MNMKRVTLVFVVFALAFALFNTGCKKDDDKKNGDGSISGNHFAYDGKQYPLAQGFLIYYGEWKGKSGIYDYDIVLASSGLIYNDTLEEFTGKGHVVYYELLTSSETELLPGTYNYDSTAMDIPNSYQYAFFMINYDVDEDEAEVDKYIREGSISVEKTGSNYNLIYNGKTEDEKNFTGKFIGPLHFIDWSYKKKK